MTAAAIVGIVVIVRNIPVFDLLGRTFAQVDVRVIRNLDRRIDSEAWSSYDMIWGP